MKDKTGKVGFVESLKVALRLELEGHRFFAEAAAKSRGSHSRQTFQFLAAEELKHIERIKQLSDSIAADAGIALPAGLSAEDTSSKMESFFENLSSLKEEFSPDSTDIEAYRFAIRFENGAEEFYASQLTESQHPVVAEFYRWLIKEEEMHARLLESCLKFAEDPTSWFNRRK